MKYFTQTIISIVFVLIIGLMIWSETKIQTEIAQAPQECPACLDCPEPQLCEPEVIIKEVPIEKIKEVIKEVPVEKIIYRDKVIYQTNDQDCRIELSTCKSVRQDLFAMYSENLKALESYRATTTDFRISYQNLLYQFETLIDLTFGLNRDYLFQPRLSERLNEFIEIASTSRAFLAGHK